MPGRGVRRIEARGLREPQGHAELADPQRAWLFKQGRHFRTDESGIYWKVGEEFATHRTVNHSAEEYVRGDAHTNTAEGMFSILKRGIYGIYQHVSEAPSALLT
jgi:hypothetical protein